MKKYENYVSALKSLRKAPEQDLSNDFIQSGIIDKFELQFELGWLMRGTLFPLPVLREMCSKPLSNITISWTNRCGCVCCAIAMILLISTMRNAPGVL